jgi:3-isopropylmalate/(R)-2-methylmalate dehydratase small subunit
MVKDDPSRLLVVDVERLSVEVPDTGWHRAFVLDPMTRERLLEGWDDIGISLRRADAITSYEATSVAPSLVDVFDDEGRTRYA